MNILLISGHAGTPYDPGATATIDGTYYEEATLNIEVVDRLEKLLRDKYGANVSVYDRKRDAYKDYKAGTLSFGSGIDYILECHFNACVKDYAGDGRTTGTEIYWPSRGKATGAENAILERVCAVGFRNRGAQSMALAVINTAARAGIPANLIEVCFIDDADDMRLWLKNKDRICEAIAAGVAAHFGLKEKEEEMFTYNEFKKYMQRYEAEKAAAAPSEYAKDSAKKAIASGLFKDGDGDGSMDYPRANLTREQFATVLDRAGLLDKAEALRIIDEEGTA